MMVNYSGSAAVSQFRIQAGVVFVPYNHMLHFMFKNNHLPLLLLIELDWGFDEKLHKKALPPHNGPAFIKRFN